MARSIAILLMLEGHFVHETLLGRDAYEVAGNHPVFEVWSFVRGYTSTIFLTVTGVVFAYLLAKNDDPFSKNPRVKRGVRRAGELLVLGYLLQPDAFHVLQCIAVGMLAVLGIHALGRRVGCVPLWSAFGAAGTAVFFGQTLLAPLHADLAANPGYGFPENAPVFVQNMIFAGEDRAVIPLMPHLGFVLLGAMLGCLLHDLRRHVRTRAFVWGFIASGILIHFASAPLPSGWLFAKFGGVMVFLGLLMLVEKALGPLRPGLFLKLGQNTLIIFATHIAVLYWIIPLAGLDAHLYGALDPWQAAAGALVFIGLFVLLVRHLEDLHAGCREVRMRLALVLDRAAGMVPGAASRDA